MTWWLSDAAKRMRREIDVRYRRRDKRSDGWIGDTLERYFMFEMSMT